MIYQSSRFVQKHVQNPVAEHFGSGREKTCESHERKNDVSCQYTNNISGSKVNHLAKQMNLNIFF